MFLPMLVTEGAQGMLDPGWGCGGGGGAGGRRMEGQAARGTHLELEWEATGGLWPRSKSPNQRIETGIGGWLKKENHSPS